VTPATVTIYVERDGFRVVVGEHKAPAGPVNATEFQSLPHALACCEQDIGPSRRHRDAIMATLRRMMNSHAPEEFALAPAKPAKRKGRFVSAAMIAAAVVALTGCAGLPGAVLIEGEHVSHPTVGPPMGDASAEDSLNQLNALAEWRDGGAYLVTGLGYRIGDGGFYGPRLTFTARAGYRFPVKP
jgi:hypothetical protein